MAHLRPWQSDLSEASSIKEGERVDVKWADGVTSAHEFGLRRGIPGFWLIHHDTKIWVELALVQYRKIPGAKKLPRDPKPRPRNPHRGSL